MRPLRVLIRSIKSAFTSVFRNISLSLASLSCIVITLLIVSLAIILSANANNFTGAIEDDLTIVVFVKKDATDEEIKEVGKVLNSIPNIAEIEYKNKEEIKNSVMNDNQTFYTIMDSWTEEQNPLKSTYIVKVENIELIGETATTIKNIENVALVNYGEGMVEKLVSIFNVIKKTTILAVIALIFVTAFLISNTIKITIYSRRTEINIMRLVGTSNTVIKMPFMFEGLFLGIIGSIIPILVTIYGYVLFYDKMDGIVFSDIIPLIDPYNFVFKVSFALLVIGGLVGMFGSYRAVRKFLKI